MLGNVNKLFVFKSLLTTTSNVLPLLLKQTFPHIIWICTGGEGDGIESRLPFKIFSTLLTKILHFSEYVAPDPSLDEMRKVVCIEKLRPDIPEVWLKDSVLNEITKVMQETWTEKGSSRLTALRVKKSLTTIMQCSIITDKIWQFAKQKKWKTSSQNTIHKEKIMMILIYLP